MPAESLARFSALYYVLWQIALAVSVGSASVLIALLSGHQTATAATFQITFLVEAAITLCALLAYRRLRPEDGQSVSGYMAAWAS